MCQYDPDCKVPVHPFGEVCPLVERRRKRREHLDLLVVVLAIVAASIVVASSFLGYL